MLVKLNIPINDKFFNNHVSMWKHIEEISNDELKYIVDNCCDKLFNIKNVNVDIQLYAVKKCLNNIFCIRNKSEEAVVLYLQMQYKVGEPCCIKKSRDICKNCKNKKIETTFAKLKLDCVYKFKDKIFDGCPYFLEHVALKN